MGGGGLGRSPPLPPAGEEGPDGGGVGGRGSFLTGGGGPGVLLP